MKKSISIIIAFILFSGVFILWKYFTPIKMFVKAKQEVKALNYLNLIKDGYIIFVKSKTENCKTIETLTNSKYNHLGVIIFIDGEPFVFSEWYLKDRNPIPLYSLIANSKDGKYEIRRLKKYEKKLTADLNEKYFWQLNYDCDFIIQENQDLEMRYNFKINFISRSKFNINNDILKKTLRRLYIVNINPKEFLYWPTDIYDYENLEPIVNKN